MRCRGADSPRSASPIGPAPTRLPRMALPPATVLPLAPVLREQCLRFSVRGAIAAGAGPVGSTLYGGGLVPVLDLEPERDDRRCPEDADEDGEPVEVLLHHR